MDRLDCIDLNTPGTLILILNNLNSKSWHKTLKDSLPDGLNQSVTLNVTLSRAFVTFQWNVFGKFIVFLICKLIYLK